MEQKILIAGFGGQGILFSGKFLVYAGMLEGREVTWLPSYGPEMRGGTANCSVIFSESPVGSPIVATPDLLVAMNLPSYDKFEHAVVPDGRVFVDSSLIARAPGRVDVATFHLPATTLAEENGLIGLANMVMLGKLIRETGLCDRETISAAMGKVVPERKRDLFDKNLMAIQIGLEYQE